MCGFIIIYIILSVFTTRYVITNQGILIRKGPFSRKFREMSYCDVNNITIKQGSMQKRFKIGNLTINTGSVSRVFKGIRNPHQIKELINKEKASEYERRTLLRKILQIFPDYTVPRHFIKYIYSGIFAISFFLCLKITIPSLAVICKMAG